MKDTPFGHRHKLGGCYATWLIEFKSKELDGKYGLSDDDLGDLRQELTLHLLKQWPQYDASKAKITTFIQAVIETRIREVLRDRGRAKRDYRQQRPLGHDAESGLMDGVRGQPEVSDFDQVDLRLDVETILARLPLELRWIATQLQHDSPETVAARMGIPKTTLCRRMLEIRERFEAAGYGLNDLATVLRQKECA